MARFRGTLQGRAGRAARLGDKGMKATVQSEAGDVVVEMNHNGRDRDLVWIGYGEHGSRVTEPLLVAHVDALRTGKGRARALASTLMDLLDAEGLPHLSDAVESVYDELGAA